MKVDRKAIIPAAVSPTVIKSKIKKLLLMKIKPKLFVSFSENMLQVK